MSPSGGVLAASGSMSRTPSNPQKDEGKRGQTMSTLMLLPSGAKVVCWFARMALDGRVAGDGSSMGGSPNVGLGARDRLEVLIDVSCNYSRSCQGTGKRLPLVARFWISAHAKERQ